MTRVGRRLGIWAAGVAVAAVAALSFVIGLIALATIVFANDSLTRCFDEAGRGTIGMVAAAVSGLLLPVLLAVAVLRVRRGRGATALPIALGLVVTACMIALIVGAGQEACPDAALSTEDSDGTGVVFVADETLAANTVVAACTIAAAVLLWRRRTTLSSAGRGTPTRPPT